MGQICSTADVAPHHAVVTRKRNKTSVSDEKLEGFLRTIPIFSRFTDEERARLIESLEEFKYHAGDEVIREGDVGDRFYLIMEGTCEVSTSKSSEVFPLSTSDFFGEAALTEDVPRAATVSAKSDVRVLSLTRDNFKRHVLQTGKVRFAKRGAISAETFKKASSSSMRILNEQGAVHPEDEATRELISRSVQENLLFSVLKTAEQLREVIDSMFLTECRSGDVIIRQGDTGDNFYVVAEGSFRVFVDREGKREQVADKGPADSFGELALMYNCPRLATVIATADSKLWTLSRRTFRRILANISRDHIRETEELLRRVPEFGALTRFERSQVAEAMTEVSFRLGENVIRQGDDGDAFYIIKRGEVVVRRDGTEVERLHEGDFFGEMALISNDKRTVDVVATTDLVCLSMDRLSFIELLGPVQDILARTRTASLQPTEDSFDEKRNGTAQDHLRRDILMKDLKSIAMLGRGTFGRVRLVKHTKTSTTYALKAISKAQVVQLGQQEHIMNEKRMMALCNHPFLVNLVTTFKDKNCLYFLMEVSLGGELFTLLNKHRSFDERTARFYAGCVVLAFEYLQQRDIIHRDLKPENLLLDRDGYIKLTDFGFAKICKDRTFTLCGTPDYLAPEVISGVGHGKPVDWWTLGILVYEMLAGYPPFYDDHPMKTYQRIVRGKFEYPEHFSPEARDLISKLLQQTPHKRLGVLHGGAENVKRHDWFRGFSWEDLFNKRIKAPIAIQVANPEDHSNFDHYEDRIDFAEFDGDSSWDAEF